MSENSVIYSLESELDNIKNLISHQSKIVFNQSIQIRDLQIELEQVKTERDQYLHEIEELNENSISHGISWKDIIKNISKGDDKNE